MEMREQRTKRRELTVRTDSTPSQSRFFLIDSVATPSASFIKDEHLIPQATLKGRAAGAHMEEP
jgi:hypothetical protein